MQRINKFLILFLILLFSINIFCESINDNYKVQLEIDEDLKSMGYIYYDNYDYNSHILGFNFHKKLYSVDYYDSGTNGNLDVFGDFKYAFNEKYLAVGSWSSPSGHGRHIFIFSIKNEEPKLISVVSSGNEDFIEVDNIQGKISNQIKFLDYDKDDQEELLLSFLNSGYIFIEINNDGLSIDYDKKNYQEIDSEIKDESKKKFNKEFLYETINKKKISKKLKIYSSKEFILKKLGEEK